MIKYLIRTHTYYRSVALNASISNYVDQYKKIMQNFECVKFVYICSLIIIKVLTVFLIDHVKGFSIIESLSKAFDDPVSYVYTQNIEFYHVLFLKTHGQ